MMTEPTNSIFCHLSAVSSKDFDDVYNNARITQLEEALRLEEVLPSIRTAMYGGNQRTFVASIVRFIDAAEPAKMDTRNSQEWVNRGYSSTFVDYLDEMAKVGLIKYDRTTKIIRPTARLAALAQITTTKVIAA